MAQLFIITSSTRPMSCRVPSGKPSPPSAYQSLTDSVFWKMTSLRRFRSIAATWALLCIMKLRPTWPEEFASPPGCRVVGRGEQQRGGVDGAGGQHEPAASDRGRPVGALDDEVVDPRPGRSVTIRRTRSRSPAAGRCRPAPGRWRRSRRRSSRRAGRGSRRRCRTGCSRRPGPRSTPIALALGCTPVLGAGRARSATYGSCSSAGCGYGELRQGSVGSWPAAPCTR